MDAQPKRGSPTRCPGTSSAESHVLTAHLIENEQRGELTYSDRANGVVELKTQLEREQNRVLSLSDLEEELRPLAAVRAECAG